MKRRGYFIGVLLPFVLAGCTGPGSESVETTQRESETARSTTDETETATTTTPEQPSPASTTSDSCWPQMCADSTLVEVQVSRNFDGTVVLAPNCREGERTVEPGETTFVRRRSEGEQCTVRLTVDGETAFEEEIAGYERATLTVTPTGSVETDWIVY